jgi:hypothetical protein
MRRVTLFLRIVESISDRESAAPIRPQDGALGFRWQATLDQCVISAETAHEKNVLAIFTAFAGGRDAAQAMPT